MTNEQHTTSLAELLQKHIEQQPVAPVAPKYTLEEALPLVKEEYELYTIREALPLVQKEYSLYSLSDALGLIANAREVWDKIKDCETSMEILNQFYCPRLDGSEDFDDLDLEEFIGCCEAIINNPEDVEVPEDFIEDWDLKEYFTDNIYDMWQELEYGGSITKDTVRQAYIENGGVDLDEYINNFRL